MLRLTSASFGLVVLSLPISAQSIRVDFQPAGSALGTPSPTYGVSNGRVGVWNAVSSPQALNLRAWDGTPTNVSLSTSEISPGCLSGGTNLFVTYDNPQTSGEDERFLDDGYSPDEFRVKWTFNGLAPGDYDVDTIMLVPQPCSGAQYIIGVEGSPDPPQYVAARWNGSYVQGGTSSSGIPGSNFARHRKTVTDGTIEISIDNHILIGYFQNISGIVLNKHEPAPVGTNLCFGDGSVTACPCSNNGSPGTGCQNSAGTGGSWLFATGSLDSLVLHAVREMPNALSIFLQGTGIISPVAYGDGLRCATGALKRMYTKSANGGVVFAPGPGNLSIRDRSASLGIPLPAGSRTYYQVYYRDANASFCPAPQGNTFNVSNAVKILW